MRKETMDRRLDTLRRWLATQVEESETRQLSRQDVRAIMEDEMGWIDPRTQDRWITILARRKHLIPLNVEGTVFYVPEKRYRSQKALGSFDIPEVNLEVED